MFAFVAIHGSASLIALLPNCDIGWVVEAGARLLEGGVLYRDVVDIHPPLVFWWSAAVGAAARATGIDSLLAYDLFTLAHVFLAFLLIRALTQDWRGPAAAAVALLPLIGADMGAGEHLFAAALLPYLALAERRSGAQAVPIFVSVAVGVVLGLGISRKPFLAVAWLVTEGWLLARGLGLRRPETASVLVTGAVYLVAVVALVPEYFGFAFWAYPTYADFSPLGIAELMKLWQPLVGLLLVTGILAFDRAPAARLHALVGASLLVVAAAQGHGWSYHWYPALAVLTVWTIRRILSLRFGFAAVIFATSVVMLMTHAKYDELRLWPYMLPRTQAVLERHGGPVLALSTLMQHTYPVLNIAGVQSASRFPTQWLIPGGYQRGGHPFPYNAPEHMERAERFMFESTVEDLLNRKPAVIFVDTMPPRPYPAHRAMTGFSWIDYYSHDQRFREAFQQYRELPRISNLRVFVRTEERTSH